jgi:hypothetical protein
MNVDDGGDFEMDEHALLADEIIPDLPANETEDSVDSLAAAPPDSPALSLSTSSLSSNASYLSITALVVTPEVQPTASPPPPTRRNERVTSLMALQRAEDEYMAAVRDALDAGVPRNELEPMISQSVAIRLGMRSSGKRRASGVENDGLGASSEPKAPQAAAAGKENRVPAFERQKKSRRHESYGIR